MKILEKNPGREKKKLLSFFRSMYDYTGEYIVILNKEFEIMYSSESFKNAVYGDVQFSEGKKLQLYGGQNTLLNSSELFRIVKKRGFWKGTVRLGSGSMFLDAGLKLICIKNPPGNKRMMLCVFNFKEEEPSELIDADTYKLFRLLNDTIINSNRSNDIYSSIQYSIDRICGFTQWEIGHCFLVISGNLFSTKIWNSDFNPADNFFKEFTDRIDLKTRESMASECIKKRVHFRKKLKDIDVGRFKRIAILRKLGYKTGYWYPLKLKDEITGVLEFFSRKAAYCKTGIFEGISNVSYELGSMIQRIRASESARINDKINALGRFSAGIAHEIRNPLTNISALSQLLLEEDFPEESKQHLRYIVENTNIANNIISNLLNFVSADDTHFEKNDFRKFINTIAAMAEVRCRGKKIKFIKNIARYFPEIRYDKVKLESAVLNIISNAIDSISGKGTVSLEVFPSAAGEGINIFVRDNGEGISSDNIDKIFDPFFSTKDTGTGLGLGLSRQTIILHGGTLNINSKQGIGTVAEIRLPAERKL